jgi:polysaccharide biosynthesis/export protein
MKGATPKLLHSSGAAIVVLWISSWVAVACGQTTGGSLLPDLRSLPLGGPESTSERTALSRPALAGAVDPEHYRLGPGDVLSLEYGGKALDAKTLNVDAEGRVRVPNLGLVLVGGRTLTEAREEILKRLRSYVPGADVDLRLIQARTFKVFVTGDVRQPGTQQVVGSARVLEAIEAAGGTDSIGSRRNVRVLRRDGRVAVADLVRFERTGDWDSNPYLEDGDRVIVPVAADWIGIFGSVALPDYYEFRAGDSLRTALGIAGGTRPEARLDSVMVIRFHGAQFLDTLYSNVVGVADPSIPLQADDRVFVRPKAEWRPKRQVAIAGEVRFPGPYAIEEGKSRVSDLVRWAGGFTALAAERNVILRRNLPAASSDPEFERLSRLSRGEMTNSEYQLFRAKLALRQSAYLVDFSSGMPRPLETDVFLRDGDVVDVPRIEMAVRIDGNVKNPGLVDFVAGRSVDQYVWMVGGTTKRADWRGARLTRAGSSTSLYARDVKRVEPGDFIFIPEKKDTSIWTVMRDVIIVTGQVATVVLVVNQLGK